MQEVGLQKVPAPLGSAESQGETGGVGDRGCRPTVLRGPAPTVLRGPAAKHTFAAPLTGRHPTLGRHTPPSRSPGRYLLLEAFLNLPRLDSAFPGLPIPRCSTYYTAVKLLGFTLLFPLLDWHP